MENAIESLIADPTFWVGFAFLCFVLLFAKKALPFIIKALDNKSDQIRKELEEARTLREEAQALLVSYQKKQREVLADAERILKQAEKESQELKSAASARLEEDIQRRVALANEKIARAEAQALKKVQNNIVDIAVLAAQELIVERIEAGGDEELITVAVEDIDRIIH